MLKLKNISFAYSNQEVLTNISFTVGKGENVAIVGESGSGKSTLLSAIYGRFDLKKGDISWNDTEILGPAYNLVVGYDFIKYVSQEFDLMPFTTVGENVGKYLSNFYPKSKKNRTDELIAVVGLEDFTNTKVKNLSGGQKQRVALARALANEPELLLMDEPFSDIDNFKKNGLRRKLFSYLKNNKISCLVATHDKEDVLGFADKMLVLHKGKVMANDTPNHLFENPESPLVASFFAEYNILPDRLVESKNSNLVYAHELEVVAESGFEVKVKNSYYKGTKYLIEGLFENRSIFFYHNLALEEGDKVSLKISRKRPQ